MGSQAFDLIVDQLDVSAWMFVPWAELIGLRHFVTGYLPLVLQFLVIGMQSLSGMRS